MSRFNGYQISATVCIAFFIVSISLGILSLDRFTYRKSLEAYYDTMSSEELASQQLDKHEKIVCYDILADHTTAFFKADYHLPGHDIAAVNVERLRTMGGYIRAAWMIAVISAVGAIYSFIVLNRRRLYMPLAYGSAVSAFLVSIMALRVMTSKKLVFKGIKNMILYRDYGYFIKGDIVREILPPDFARWLALEYLAIVLIVIIIFVLTHLLIKRSGRPHKF